MATREEIVQSVPQKGFFGHPKGLLSLFFTEFWERFSYYGMRAILLYYMYDALQDGGLGLEQSTANSIMAVYGSLVYMSGIIGGWIADRLFGTAKTVFYGGIAIMLGHIVLALPGGGLTTLFISMAFIIIGTGLLKPNISSIVGDMYADNDVRRDSGFSIFYMGINMGAFIAPLIVGSVVDNYNYHFGFGLAAIGMFFGLVVFMLTKKKFLGLAGSYVPNPMAKGERVKVFTRIAIALVAVLIIGFILIQNGIMTINVFTMIVSILGIVIPTIFFIVMYRSAKTNEDEKSRVLAYIPLFIAAMVFWAIAEQGSIILASYADQRTDLTIGSWEIKPAWFQSLNPLFVIALAPVFAWLWVRLGGRQPSTPKKFAFGLFFASMSFLVMIIPAYLNGTDTLVSPYWLVLSFFLVVIGELLLSPVGLSATTKLAPQAFAAQTMSLWFLTSASAQAINAQVVKFYNPENEITYFGVIGVVALVVGILLYFCAPIIEKYMRGVR
jgi:POT family proton-dependent oligopeptide transporter